MLRAAEGALRRAELHRSAGDIEMVLRTFLAVQQRNSRLEGEQAQVTVSQPQFTPRRQPRTAQPRRIPGLTRKLR